MVIGTTSPGAITINSDGTFTYTPGIGFRGKETITVRVCDNGSHSRCDTTTLTLLVNKDMSSGVNYAPDANDDIVSTGPGATISGNVLVNDNDKNGDLLTATILGIVPVGFSMNRNGNFTYIPSINTVDTKITVRYSACDNNTLSKCNTASLSILINPKIADLTIISKISNANISGAAAATNLVLTVAEVFGGKTNAEAKPVYLRLLKNDQVFTYSYDPAQVTMNSPGATSIENSKWELISETSAYILFRLRAGNDISAYGYSALGIKLTKKAVTTTGTTTITSLVVNHSGGDINHTNNYNNVLVNVQ